MTNAVHNISTAHLVYQTGEHNLFVGIAKPLAQVIVLTDLVPNSFYVVEVVFKGWKLQGPERVSFRTPPTWEQSLRNPWRAISVSCDRHSVDQNDDSFIAQLSADTYLNYDMMFHLGDQVYGDHLEKQLETSSPNEMIEAFRDLYREAWHRQAYRPAMRHGSHLMIPDDHELINGVSFGSGATKKNITHHQLFLAAGVRAILEYERQLVSDIVPFDAAFETQSLTPMYFSFEWGRSIFLFLDLRFYQAFYNDDNAPLTGVAQLKFVKEFLTTQLNRVPPPKSLVVLSSISLLFPNHYLSLLVDAVEGDRYPLHPTKAANTAHLLNLFLQAGRSVRTTLLSGDLHLFAEEQICKYNGTSHSCLNHMITSGLTQHSSIARYENDTNSSIMT